MVSKKQILHVQGPSTLEKGLGICLMSSLHALRLSTSGFSGSGFDLPFHSS